MFVKTYLTKFIRQVDTHYCDQMWINLSLMPNVWIGGCYIPPSDSPYFTEYHFSSIQERFIDSSYTCILLGDLNSRCGKDVSCLLNEKDIDKMKYLDLWTM